MQIGVSQYQIYIYMKKTQRKGIKLFFFNIIEKRKNCHKTVKIKHAESNVGSKSFIILASDIIT